MNKSLDKELIEQLKRIIKIDNQYAMQWYKIIQFQLTKQGIKQAERILDKGE